MFFCPLKVFLLSVLKSLSCVPWKFLLSRNMAFEGNVLSELFVYLQWYLGVWIWTLVVFLVRIYVLSLLGGHLDLCCYCNLPSAWGSILEPLGINV